MKKYGLLIVLFMIVSSFFGIKGIYAYLTSTTNTESNVFTVKQTTTYTVIHQKMNLDGSYTIVSQDDYEDALGATVSPAVNTYTGFISPSVQTVTLNSFNNTVITYSYDRIQYHLTINDSMFVTTSTPTGDYYYGTSIHLVADEYNNLNNPFLRWTNGVTNRDYTFTLTEDTIIAPHYAGTFQVTYVHNNGESNTSNIINEGQNIGTFPTLEYNDCDNTQGSYEQRNCTYYYVIEDWYLDSGFVNKVSENYIPTDDITVYAKWNKIYFHEDSHQFNNNHLLDTGISLFSEENASKDFIVSFVVDSRGSSDDRDVIFANMNETGDPYPGVNFRWYSSSYNINVNVALGNKKNNGVTYNVGDTVILKRENGIFYYSMDGGTNFVSYQDFSNFDLYFDRTATFGGNTNSAGNPWRFFNGTLTDMTVEIIEPDTYTITYNSNGGIGFMSNQRVPVHHTTNLISNTFINSNNRFGGWNTQADGSGTSYSNGEQVTDIANTGETITLYAQWVPPDYHIHFDANGGTGTMDNQGFIFGESQNLNTSTFTKSGYIFGKWNTQPDGSGTSYEDEDLVTDLTNNHETITLYAMYEKVEFSQSGTTTFDGVDDYLDTGVNIYSSTTINKDFNIKFDVIYVDPANKTNGQTQPTIMNTKDETNTTYYPGFVVRLGDNDADYIRPTGKWGGGAINMPNVKVTYLPVHYEFKRRDGKVYYMYSYNNFNSGWVLFYNQGSWNLPQYFNDNIVFGAISKNGIYDRFFKGTVSDIEIAVAE